jgi:zinc transport system substrate-binding protein
MKIILACGLCSLTAAGCGGDGRTEGSFRRYGPEHVVAAFYPLAFAAQAIGGPDLDVRNLTPPGAEPHDLELSPADVRQLRSADLVLLLGDGFQPQLEDAAGDGARVLRLLDTDGLERFPNGDPHVWLDPLRYAVIARRVGVPLYREPAARAFAARLRALDQDFRRGLAHCERRELVTSHAAFGYLAQRYGLRQLAITGLSPEAEPTPRQLERVVDRIRETHATTVFVEPLVSPRLADAAAREAGVQTAVLDPLEGLTKAEAKRGEDYFSRMRANLAALREALGCR